MSDSSEILANVEVLTAALFFGNLFNWGLFGCLVVQIYFYYLNYSTDGPAVRGVVAFALVLEIVQTILVTHDAFITFCSQWGTPSALLQVGYIWLTLPIFGSLMSFIAQSFYAWRLHLLAKTRWLPAIIILISLTQLIAGIVTGAIVIGINDVRDLHKSFKAASVWLAGTALCDIIIAMSMVIFLTRSKTGFHRTDVLLTRIIVVTIETGFASAIVALVDMILFLTFRDENWHLCTAMMLSKLYANSLLVVLNSRKRIITQAFSESDEFYSMGRLASSNRVANRPHTINISVSREVHGDSEAIHVPMTGCDIKDIETVDSSKQV
ncbi:uncharacterized protein BT62DRAFT_240290 [Guyanagaster necrorhizus]|uniref:DUF6534 domain-containing protein n=1 Tax=Guyanagaster necrorhizus TaxID=856835 RepID=A0A9P7VND9_9AGAR|nr:uncharacterized protein BT62DRAFT_240290 [Guyanagaster necrorhizus MCA 3950]KAG7444391.1 hypothetical protein BT62DRAFT_240290 [Guyanagaster necrorhizus MCA 3950]